MKKKLIGVMALLIGLAMVGTNEANAAGFSAVSTASAYSCAISDAGVQCWGAGWGADPVVKPDLNGSHIFIASGDTHTCVVTSSGGVKCFGSNETGQLGDGTTQAGGPVVVCKTGTGQTCEPLADIAGVAAGSGHSCALTTAGGVKCWGRNKFGHLGDGSTVDSLAPVDVIGLASGVSNIEAEDDHTCAIIAADGSVKCWGRNQFAQLGVPSQTETCTVAQTTEPCSTIPRNVTVEGGGMLTGMASVTPGEDHTCALAEVGAGVKCWGRNQFGQLGSGEISTMDSDTASDVCASGSAPCQLFEAAALAAGDGHTCAILVDGSAACWGGNDSGQLGIGSSGPSQPNPVAVLGLSGAQLSQVALDGGELHTCVATTLGTVKCWGDNSSSQLGDGTSIDRTTPVDVIKSVPPVTPKFDALFAKAAGLEGPPGLQVSLRAKLNTALRLVQRDNSCASANVLGAFLNQVQAESGGMIPTETADLLIAQADNIVIQLLDGISCPPDPDTDGDLMSDSAEVTLETNPAKPDTDSDLANDGLELLEMDTDPLDIDTDNDGCADGEEIGPNETLGGQRNPLSFWDFIDPTRDGTVDFFDFLALLRHYGTTGDPSGFAPDAAEPPTGEYWAAVDRGGTTVEGGYPWDELPPDGEINFDDFLSLLRQYGHSCKATP